MLKTGMSQIQGTELSRFRLESPTAQKQWLQRTKAGAVTFLICICRNISAEAAYFVINAISDATPDY